MGSAATGTQCQRTAGSDKLRHRPRFQADVALRETEKTGELVEAISERSEGERR